MEWPARAAKVDIWLSVKKDPGSSLGRGASDAQVAFCASDWMASIGDLTGRLAGRKINSARML